MNHLLLDSLLQLNFFSKFKIGYIFLSFPYFLGNLMIYSTQIADHLFNLFLLLNNGYVVIGLPNESRQFVAEKQRCFPLSFFSFQTISVKFPDIVLIFFIICYYYYYYFAKFQTLTGKQLWLSLNLACSTGISAHNFFPWGYLLFPLQKRFHY